MQNVEIPSRQIIRDLVATCIRSLGYEKCFFDIFESTGRTMDTVVMKNIFPIRYEIHY